MDTEEEWRWVAGYEGAYQVSDHGNVRSLRRREPRLMVGFIDKDGYRIVRFRRPGGHRRSFRVPVLVLTTFVGDRPAGSLACHNDGTRTNNHISNLRWDTPAANVQDQLRHGTSKLDNTHCVRGHEYTPENTGPGRQGAKRSCLECASIRRKKYAQRSAEMRRIGLPDPEDPRHGRSTSGYTHHGCRCERCIASYKTWWRAYYARKKSA